MTDWRREGQIFLLAVGFLTRLPVPADPDFSDAKLNAASRYFPWVGLLIGAVASLVMGCALWLFGSLPLAVLISMAASLLLTGAFHEDGLADSADGLGGGLTREDVLRIMKDSRIGSYGTAALMMVLAIKAVSLVSIAELAAMVSALLWGHVLSRGLAISFLLDLPYIRDEGKSKPLATQMAPRGFALALLPVLPLLLLAQWPNWACLLIGLLALRVVATAYLRRRLGGYTGDILGAIQQIAEILVYLAFLL